MFFLIFFPAFSICVISIYIASKGSNTSYGFDSLSMIIPLTVCAIFCFFYATRQKTKYKKNTAYFGFAVNILAIIFFFSLDYFNIMIEKKKWMSRGEPKRFQTTSSKDISKPVFKIDVTQ